MSVPLMSFTSMPSGAGAFEDCMNSIGGGTKKNVLHKKTFCLISESDAQGSPSPHTFDTVALFGIYPSVSPLHSFGQKKKKRLSSSLLSIFENWESFGHSGTQG